MAEPPIPPPRGEQDRTLSRVLGVAGVAGLFVVLIVIITLIAGAGDDDGDNEQAAATPTATETATPTRTPKPKPTPVPLTADQKLDRQNDIDVVRSRGFEVVDNHDWKPDDTLQVLIGKSSSGGMLAFFFVDNQYLGNDSTDVSAKLRLRKTDDLEVTLRYGIYQAGDEPDKPTGDPLDIDFRYAAGQVTPVQAIPAPEQRTPGRFTG
jgi:LppP/LprE lipoprotein